MAEVLFREVSNAGMVNKKERWRSDGPQKDRGIGWRDPRDLSTNDEAKGGLNGIHRFVKSVKFGGTDGRLPRITSPPSALQESSLTTEY